MLSREDHPLLWGLSLPLPPPPSLRFRKVFVILWVSLCIVAWHRSEVCRALWSCRHEESGYSLKGPFRSLFNSSYLCLLLVLNYDRCLTCLGIVLFFIFIIIFRRTVNTLVIFNNMIQLLNGKCICPLKMRATHVCLGSYKDSRHPSSHVLRVSTNRDVHVQTEVLFVSARSHFPLLVTDCCFPI